MKPQDSKTRMESRRRGEEQKRQRWARFWTERRRIVNVQKFAAGRRTGIASEIHVGRLPPAGPRNSALPCLVMCPSRCRPRTATPDCRRAWRSLQGGSGTASTAAADELLDYFICLFQVPLCLCGEWSRQELSEKQPSATQSPRRRGLASQTRLSLFESRSSCH